MTHQIIASFIDDIHSKQKNHTRQQNGLESSRNDITVARKSLRLQEQI